MSTGWPVNDEEGNRTGCVVTARAGALFEDGRVTSILWYRRDLRVHDLPALQAAVGAGPVLPLFVFDDRLVHGRWPSANRVWFMLESLKVLDQQLRERGARLHVRRGRPEEVIPALALEAGAEAVFISRDYSPFARRRDAQVAEALGARGIAFHAQRGTLVHEPEHVHTDAGQPYSVYGPFRRRWESLPRREVSGAPGEIPCVAGVDAGKLPDFGEFGLAEPAPEISTPGETEARNRLDGWAAGGIRGYAAGRDMLAAGATSRLSQDLRWGLLSPLEVVERCGGSGDDSAKFIAEAVWREFYHHVLWHHPRVLREPFRTEFAAIRWDSDRDALEAWKQGRTGFPLVDAGMRELLATGHMHNRARMIAASFLAKDLLLDWRLGEGHFMAHLVDGDVANNDGGWQWAASVGTDPQPYFRIFNPYLQAKRFDPDGAYVRRWVPELANVPDRYLREPHAMPHRVQRESGCLVGVDYPRPVVDHQIARERALAVFSAVRTEKAAPT